MENQEPKTKVISNSTKTTSKIIFFSIGVFSSFFYLFNSLAIIVGIIFFFSFRDRWKTHGLVLSLATSIATIAPQQELVSFARIYPFALVVGLALGLIFVYFIVLLSNKLPKINEFYRKTIDKFRFNSFKNLKRKKLFENIFLTSLILSSTIIWLVGSISFDVMFNNKPKLLWVHAPTTVQPETEFDVSVQCWDKFERLSAVYKGKVEFALESYNLSTLEPLTSVNALLPQSYTFNGQSFPSDYAYMIQNGKDNGLHKFQMSITTSGMHYLKVHDTTTGEIFYSNPIVVQNSSTNIYWGDIHTHSIYSDGSGTPAHAFYYAKNVACLDFYSLTEHGEIISLLKLIDKYIVQTHNEYIPHEFVTFLGMEYTNHDTGHYTCIFDGETLLTDPIIGYRSIETPFDLWNALDTFTATTSSRVLALPHHIVKERYIQDWTYYNPSYVKIAEVTSTHGDNLYNPHHPLSYRGSTAPPKTSVNGTSITDALKMGLKLSLYASSDAHDGHPGHSLSHSNAHVTHQRPYTFWWTRQDKPYPGGLTAVYANELTRSTIFTQLQNRAMYATSDHGRPYLDFSINGRTVGGNSTVTVSNVTSPRVLDILIAQDGAPASSYLSPAKISGGWTPNWKADVEILKNGELFKTFTINQPVAKIQFTDSSSITGTSFGEESCIMKNDKYYLNKYSDNPVNPDDLTSKGMDFYIIRIVSENGRHTYIGPIWVNTMI